MQRHHLLVAGCLLVLTFLSASPAQAGLTSVQNPKGTEDNTQKIIQSLYGDSVSATRLTDRNDGFSLAGTTPVGDDTYWSGSFSARAIAKFSNYTQSFGFMNDGSFQKLFDVDGFGYNVTGSTQTINCIGENWTFARDGESGTHSSLFSDNEDGRDHLITYKIDGLDGGPRWLLFWEDLTVNPLLKKGRTISDFNDLVIELRATGQGPIAVPLPPAILPGLALLGGLSLARKLRRKTAA